MIVIQNIVKKYKRGDEVFTALDDVSLEIKKNDFFAVIGASGSGKSTLLHTIGGLIHPDSGKVFYNENDIYKLKGKESDLYRKKYIGFVFQQFHLMPYLTVLENIRLACYEKHHHERINTFIDKCSLSVQKNKYPSELSVGEKQRAAFIRAIISEPELLLADEPTGNLDPRNSEILLDLIIDYHKSGGTIVLVSHDTLASGHATRTILLEKGKLSDNSPH
jgi:putative ABC transport system ATP-binding protein